MVSTLAKATSLIDRTHLSAIKTNVLLIMGRIPEALACGRAAARAFGIDLPERPDDVRALLKREIGSIRDHAAAVGIENLDAVVVGVDRVDVPLRADRYVKRVPELTGAGAELTPLEERSTAGVERLQPVVVGVGDEEPVLGVDREAKWGVELSRAATERSPLVAVVVAGIEDLDPVVEGVGDVGVAERVEGDSGRRLELFWPGAGTAPRGDEAEGAGRGSRDRARDRKARWLRRDRAL